MSPRTICALLLSTGFAMGACARASDFGLEDDEENGASSGSTTGTGGTTTSATTGDPSSTAAPAATTSGGAMGGNGGAGGAVVGAGGMGAGGMGGAPTTGAGGNMNACAHDICTEGIALAVGCDPCVDSVCLADDFCCDSVDGEWDEFCVSGAESICGANCGTTSTLNPGDLLINEIMNNPSSVADNAGEWLEIFNATSAPIDMQGLVLRHQSISSDPNATVAISQSLTVPAGGYVVLGLNDNAATNGGIAVDYTYPSNVNLSNTSDYLAIEDGNGNTIDDVSYDEASGLDPSGASRSLDPLHQTETGNDDDTHFCVATTTMTSGDMGTPGMANDSCP